MPDFRNVAPSPTPATELAEAPETEAATAAQSPEPEPAEAPTTANDWGRAERLAKLLAALDPRAQQAADSLDLAGDHHALQKAAAGCDADAQIKLLSAYAAARGGVPFEEPQPPQPTEQQVLPSFDDVMRQAGELSAGDLPAVDQLLAQIADTGFTNAQQERLVAEIARCTGITKSTLKADLKESKKLVRAYRNPKAARQRCLEGEARHWRRKRRSKTHHGKRGHRGSRASRISQRLSDK
jgi:hypothetical protein